MLDAVKVSPDLAALLVERGLIDVELLHRINAARANNSQRLSRMLVDMGIISQDALCQLWSEILNFPVWDGEGEPFIDTSFPEGYLAYNRILPVRRNETRWLIIDDPEDDGLLDMLGRLYSDSQIALAPPQRINYALNALLQPDNLDDESLISLTMEDVGHLKDLALEAPTISRVNEMIARGVDMGASDIHLEPGKNHIDLRYRVDGVLHAEPAPSTEDYPAIISRIKILSSLDIAERRLPQDGRIRLRLSGREVDIRVSTLPTAHGEDVVLRLLDQKQQSLSLEATGMSAHTINLYKRNLARSTGLILVTGPTGSGKSTTLYSGLAQLIDGKRKIITVEDPVEYELPGISQIQINEPAGLTFAAVLRSILRHDPDTIFIGEIRDKETAEIAVQASLTGHLVLSTIHTNSAAGAIGRFLDMGVADYLLASSLVAISAQRLVRRLCDVCKQAIHADPATSERFGISPSETIYRAEGCQKCSKTGYQGRLAIAELLEITSALRQQILHDPSIEALNNVAQREAFISLIEDGIIKVKAGLTTVEEVLRVAG